MPKMIRCPHHDDSTASLAIYENGQYCYGCGYTEQGPQDYVETSPILSTEEIQKEYDRIQVLPTSLIRGLYLKSDADAYYVLWPEDGQPPYYKARSWSSEEGPRYKAPRGAHARSFWARKMGAKSLIVVEGEINALSLNTILDPSESYDIMSPGPATNFFNKKSNELLTLAESYDKLYIVVDDDLAGLRAAVKLHMRIPNSIVKFMKPDINDVLVQYGDRARQHIKTNLDL